MVGETEENWRRCIEKAIDLSPDGITVYQMEVPSQHDPLSRYENARQRRRPRRGLGYEAPLGQGSFHCV